MFLGDSFSLPYLRKGFIANDSQMISRWCFYSTFLYLIIIVCGLINLRHLVNLPFGAITVLAVTLILRPTPPPPMEEKCVCLLLLLITVLNPRDSAESLPIPKGNSRDGLGGDGSPQESRLYSGLCFSIGGDLS